MRGAPGGAGVGVAAMRPGDELPEMAGRIAQWFGLDLATRVDGQDYRYLNAGNAPDAPGRWRIYRAPRDRGARHRGR